MDFAISVVRFPAFGCQGPSTCFLQEIKRFTAALGAAVFQERFGLQSLFGAALIVCGIVISQLQKPEAARRTGECPGRQVVFK